MSARPARSAQDPAKFAGRGAFQGSAFGRRVLIYLYENTQLYPNKPIAGWSARTGIDQTLSQARGHELGRLACPAEAAVRWGCFCLMRTSESVAAIAHGYVFIDFFLVNSVARGLLACT